MSPYAIARLTRIDADPMRVHALVNDLGEWQAWSPWEDLDPGLRRDYSGPTSGIGAAYAWDGNKKAGRGRMEVVESTPERIVIDVRFEKPFRSTSTSTFDLLRLGGGTEVTWTLSGERGAVSGFMMGLLKVDNALAQDLEKGLGRLKAAAEGTD